ncbi:hypothetical protein KI387_029190, partial [Taxus chinensis]
GYITKFYSVDHCQRQFGATQDVPHPNMWYARRATEIFDMGPPIQPDRARA